MTFDGTCERGGVQRAPQGIEERSPDDRPGHPTGWSRPSRLPPTPTLHPHGLGALLVQEGVGLLRVVRRAGEEVGKRPLGEAASVSWEAFGGA
jgi:hypothetical protein